MNLIIPALVALAAAIVVAYSKSETFRNIVNAVFKAVATVVVGAIDRILGALSSMLTAFGKIAQHIPGMKGLGKAALEAAGEIDGLRESMRKIPNMLETKVKVTIDQVDFAGQAVGNAAKNKAFNPTGDGLGNAVKAAAAAETRARARSDKSFAGMIADGIGSLIPGVGAVTGKAGSLMGASGALKPFAALGAQYGLHAGVPRVTVPCAARGGS